MGDCKADLQLRVDVDGEKESNKIDLDFMDDQKFWAKHYPELDAVNSVGETLPDLKDVSYLKYLPELQEMRDAKTDDRFGDNTKANKVNALEFAKLYLEKMIIKRVPSKVRALRPFGATNDVVSWAMETYEWVLDHFFYLRVHEYLVSPILANAIVEVLLRISGNSNRTRKDAPFKDRLDDYDNFIREYFVQPGLDLNVWEITLSRVRCYGEVVYCGEQKTHGEDFLAKNKPKINMDDMQEYYNMVKATVDYKTFLKTMRCVSESVKKEICELDTWQKKIDELLTVLQAQKCAGFIEEDEGDHQISLAKEAKDEMSLYQSSLLNFLFQYERIITQGLAVKTDEDKAVFIESVQANWPLPPSKNAADLQRFKQSVIDGEVDKKTVLLRSDVQQSAQQAIREFAHKFFPMRDTKICRQAQMGCDDASHVDASTFVEEAVQLVFNMIDNYLMKGQTQFVDCMLMAWSAIAVLGKFYRLNIEVPHHVTSGIKALEGRLLRLGMYEDASNMEKVARQHFEVYMMKEKDHQWAMTKAMKRKNRRSSDGDLQEMTDRLLMAYSVREELRRRKDRIDNEMKAGKLNEEQGDARRNIIDKTYSMITNVFPDAQQALAVIQAKNIEFKKELEVESMKPSSSFSL